MRNVRPVVWVAAVLASGLLVSRSPGPVRAAGAQQTLFRAGVDLVPVYVTVTDQHGALVTDLTSDNFEIRDDGQKQKIELLADRLQPITAAILLDRSPSLFREITRTQTAIAEFARRLVPPDRACLGFFSHVVTLDPTLSGDANALLKHLGDAAPFPAGTALWDAIDAGRAALAREAGRRVILVVTDAVDNCSRADLDEVRARVEREGVMLYAIGIEGREGLLGAQLDGLTRATGGRYVEVKPTDDIAAAMKRVADELHQQYLLGFRPRRLDDRPHRLGVSLSSSPVNSTRGLVARARRSYFASSGDHVR